MNRPSHWIASLTLLAALAAGTALVAMGAAAQAAAPTTLQPPEIAR